MHELSIALNILDIVREECCKAGSSLVTEVLISVGALSGVDTEALTTCLQVASRDTLMEHARIRIDNLPGRGWCGRCDLEFDMADILDPCPNCAQPATELREGQEMRIDSILVA